MARKRQNDFATGIAQLAAGLALFGIFFPRTFLAIALGFIILVLGLLVYRRLKQENPAPKEMAASVLAPVPEPPLQSWTRPKPQWSVPPHNPPEPSRSIRVTAAEVVAKLRSIDWFQFEKLMEVAYRQQGYEVTRRGGANADGGIDLIIEKDGQRCAVQCKQWKTWNVGVKAVREFLGALTHAGIDKGVFITLRGYTGEAKKLAEQHDIEILNETGLTKMLEQPGNAFGREVINLLNDQRKFCPKCEREMLRKTAKRGRGAGQQFWACPGYPKHCNYTMPS